MNELVKNIGQYLYNIFSKPDRTLFLVVFIVVAILCFILAFTVSTPKTFLWYISLFSIISFFYLLAVGSYLHHFNSNELPKIYKLMTLKPESTIFSVMIFVLAVSYISLTFTVFNFFGDERWIRIKTSFSQKMRYLLTINGTLISIILFLFSCIRFFKSGSEYDIYSIILANLFIFLQYLFFVICDIIFIHIFGKYCSKMTLFCDILLTFIFLSFLLRNIIESLSLFVINRLYSENKYELEFVHQIIEKQFISIYEYFFFFLFFFRFVVLSWQMYGDRIVQKKNILIKYQ